jgi:hypothetical protein
MSECRHGLSEDCPGCMEETIDALLTALRRIRSLEEKNVPKYAQQIAAEAITRHVGGTLSCP